VSGVTTFNLAQGRATLHSTKEDIERYAAALRRVERNIDLCEFVFCPYLWQYLITPKNTQRYDQRSIRLCDAHAEPYLNGTRPSYYQRFPHVVTKRERVTGSRLVLKFLPGPLATEYVVDWPEVSKSAVFEIVVSGDGNQYPRKIA